MENGRPIRKCKKCGETKLLLMFPVYDSHTGARRHECTACNTNRVETWHQEHKAERLEKARVRYALDPSAHWTPERRARANELAKAKSALLRQKVLDGYGRVCACCGEAEERFLTIDHVENDGKDQRKVHGSGTSLYRWLIKRNFPVGFQTYCMNCNFGKAMNGGICPHLSKEGSTTRA